MGEKRKVRIGRLTPVGLGSSRTRTALQTSASR